MYPDPSIPGVESVSGSLGHALGIAAGWSLADRSEKRNSRNVVILGDGECYEGSIWETAMFAAHHRLENLVAIVDRNQLCILGETEELLELGDLAAKWRAFGWHVVEINGHSFEELREAFKEVGNTNGKPLAIVANTVKGKGVSFMEGQWQWHNRIPTAEMFEQARDEVRAGLKGI